MRVVILGGAGQMAQPAIKYLQQTDSIKDIVLADLHFEQVEAIAKTFNEKVTPKKVNVRDEEQLIGVIKDKDLVMNFVGPYFSFGTQILETVIDQGINYIDICDDHDTTLEALRLNEKAVEKGVTALIGMGASPGITNVLARLGADGLDQVDEINTYWLVGKTNMGGFGAMVHMFHIINEKVPVYRDGNIKYISPFEQKDAKLVRFGDPVGDVTLYPVGHPEPVTLSQYIPKVKTVTNYGGLLPAHLNQLYKTLVDFGLTSEDSMTYKDTDIKPLDFLLHYFQHKNEQDPSYFSVGEKPLGASRIEVIGMKDGEETVYTFTKSGHATMANSTSTPTAVAADLILKGEIDTKGVIPPEVIDPKKLLNPLKDTEFFSVSRAFSFEQNIKGKTEMYNLFESPLFK